MSIRRSIRLTARDSRAYCSCPRTGVSGTRNALRMEAIMAALESIDEHVTSFNSHDAHAWAARYAPDIVIHDPQYPEPLRGRAAVQKDVEDFFAAFPDIQFTVTSKTGTGDLAALEGNATGTHRGRMET